MRGLCTAHRLEHAADRAPGAAEHADALGALAAEAKHALGVGWGGGQEGGVAGASWLSARAWRVAHAAERQAAGACRAAVHRAVHNTNERASSGLGRPRTLTMLSGMLPTVGTPVLPNSASVATCTPRNSTWQGAGKGRGRRVTRGKGAFTGATLGAAPA